MTSTTLRRSEIAGLATTRTGTGRPVLLLHGVGLRAEAWQKQFDALAGCGQVIAPDMPGHGLSPCPTGEMALADYTAAMRGVLEELPGRALVIGHSMGAMIALSLASAAPEKVCGVAALNAVFERSPAAAKAVQARAADLDGKTVPDPAATLQRWFGDDLSPERSACRTWLQEVDPAGYKQAYTAFARADAPTRASLTAIKCPARFITGSLEPNSTPEMSRAMADLTPGGRAIIIKGAAHMMPLTHPEAVNAALRALAQEAPA
ncbi:alpha/beta fold hydrolase [Roseobacter ponti]|uniref:Alpha/beta hydrolase n=1 Tax=Roseobacter ponti TaxID=1891787 RepID=A0A858SMY6_9RHOB|nr:alpha/beta hydrolase [Roseobacter ponti]QJF50184.1 alpha/beta hydrolase [Roseobacter ponti]